jgi:RES domain-containing protein
MLRVWRVVTKRRSATTFSGEGARLYRGRLIPIGMLMMYPAGSQSLAVLEALAQDQPLRARYLMIPAILPKNLKVERLAPEGLSATWRSLAARE